MIGPIPTTPFGQRPLSPAVIATQRSVRECPPGKPVHKWQVFRRICEAKTPIGVSDRALSVLNALLSFHPDTVLVSGSSDLVVFPSNRTLAQRAHGIPASTLRRQLAVLVECGLILRRDSPNGKRYARKGRGGEITQAFGFDLGPIVSRADEFEHLAETIRAERRELEAARERITLCRRDIAKMIATGVEENIDADWPSIHRAYAAILGRMPRRASRKLLEPIADELAVLAAEVLSRLETHAKTQESSATESRCERHIQSSNIETPVESEPGIAKGPAARSEPEPQRPGIAETFIPLELVLKACPDLIDYARGGISNWRDLLATASLVHSLLGISPSAWIEAREAMGETRAAIVIAAILQRGASIKNPGGYLRNLTGRAANGSFSPGPMLMALIAARKRASGAAVASVTRNQHDLRQ